MLDVNSKLQKFAAGYRQTPSNDERRELEKLASEIVQGIRAGQLPTPQALKAFHDFEVVADNPRNYPNRHDGLAIIQALCEEVGNNSKLINDYNLVLHAAYFQDTVLVRRLIDVEGVDINRAVQGSKIRGESPLTVAGAMIENPNSRQIFDLIADRLPKDRKTDQGNWVSWAFAKYDLKELLIANERLEAFSHRFEIQPEMALKAATPLLVMNKDDPKEILAIQEYFERVLENMSDIKDHELFFRENLGGLIAGVLLEQDSEIQPHRKELIAKLALLSDFEFSKDLEAGNKFGEKLLKIHAAVLEMSENDRKELREMIKHPSEHMFGNLVDIVFNEEKLADFCKKLSEDKALYKLFLNKAEEFPCLKPLVEVVQENVKSPVKSIFSGFRTAKEAELHEVLGYKQVNVKDFEPTTSIEKDMQTVLKACDRYIDTRTLLPNGVIPTLNSDKIAVMKSALVKVYDTWYSNTSVELTDLGDRDLLEVFAQNYQNLKTKLEEANVQTIVEMAENLERTIGTHVKRQRDRERLRGSDAMSISGDSDMSMSTGSMSSSSSRNNSPRGRGN